MLSKTSATLKQSTITLNLNLSNGKKIIDSKDLEEFILLQTLK